MIRPLTILTIAAAAALSACAAGADRTELLKQLDANFAACERHITFQAGVGVITPGAQVSGSIDCKGAPAAAGPP